MAASAIGWMELSVVRRLSGSGAGGGVTAPSSSVPAARRRLGARTGADILGGLLRARRARSLR